MTIINFVLACVVIMAMLMAYAVIVYFGFRILIWIIDEL
jgi:hypothetical protein